MVYVKNYEILGSLGSGSFGAVSKARHPSFGIIALKKIPFGNATELARVKKEAEALKLVAESYTASHIVKYFDSFEYDNAFFIAIEFCEGGSLADYLSNLKRNNSAMKKEKVFDFLYQLCDGLDELHFIHKFGHRDLKPANIVLDKDQKTPKLTDFGLAKMIENTALHTRCGTPAYMAPEQDLRNATNYGLKVDLWALGVIFYEMAVAPSTINFSALHQSNRSLNLPAGYKAEHKNLMLRLLAFKPEDRPTPVEAYIVVRKWEW